VCMLERRERTEVERDIGRVVTAATQVERTQPGAGGTGHGHRHQRGVAHQAGPEAAAAVRRRRPTQLTLPARQAAAAGPGTALLSQQEVSAPAQSIQQLRPAAARVRLPRSSSASRRGRLPACQPALASSLVRCSLTRSRCHHRRSPAAGWRGQGRALSPHAVRATRGSLSGARHAPLAWWAPGGEHGMGTRWEAGSTASQLSSAQLRRRAERAQQRPAATGR
jgi:hypothetical protein